MNNRMKSIIKRQFRSITAAVCALALLLPMVPVAKATENLSAEPTEAIVVETTAIVPTEPVPTDTIPENTIPGETTSATETTPTEATDEAGESEILVYLRNEIVTYIATYGLTPDMPDSTLASVFFALDSEQAYAAWSKYDELLPLAMQMSAEEQEILLSEINTKLVLRFRNVMERAMSPALIAVDPVTVNNVTIAAPNASDITSSEGTITISAMNDSSTACNETSYTAKEVTITVTNAAAYAGRISFTYITDGTVSDTSPYTSEVLAAGKYTEITFTTNADNKANPTTLTLSNLAVTEDNTSYSVTVEYDAGSVTADGVAVATSGTPVAVPSSGSEFISSDTNFLAWIDTSNNKILSTDATLTPEEFKPTGDATIRAVSKIGTTAWFRAGGSYLYDDLNDASNYAAAASDKTVILMNNGTLSAGTYTIDSGVTLLIPYDDANTLCTTAPTFDGSDGFLSASANSWSKPTAYRTLTMASGANIIVNGAMSLSGMQCGAQGYNGCPTKATSFVKMESGSNITVNSGANLYVWGFITGSGSVTVKSGGTVYEDFQVKDWRGGTAASAMLDKEQKVFPITQYYVQNVEVPMTLEAGATENGFMSIVASKTLGQTTIPFIGSSGMFRSSSGSITKDYIEGEDRLKVTINGDLTMSSLVISVSSYNMDSANYVLPVTNNLDVHIASGTTTVSQDMAILPGAQITVNNGANMVLASGVNMYVYDLAEWEGKLFVYSSKDYSPLPYANGGTPVSRSLSDAVITVNGTFDASAGYLYTTTGGASICSDGGGMVITKAAPTTADDGTAIVTYQATQSGTTITFVEVPIISAQLLNANGTYVDTSSATEATTYTYCATHGVWYTGDCEKCTPDCTHDNTETIAAVAPTCTATGLTEGTKCSDCGTVITAQTEVAKLEHADTDSDHICNNGCNAKLSDCSGGTATCKELATCTVCGQEYGNYASHSLTPTPAVGATCGKAGNSAYNTCSGCGKYFDEAGTKEIEKDSWVIGATGKHEWGTPAYTWTDDNSSCTASVECQNCETTDSETVTATTQTTDGTCQTEASTTYTATFTATWATPQTVTVMGEKNAQKHTSLEYTYTNNGNGTHKKVYKCCQAVENENETHTFIEYYCACGAAEPFTITWNVDGTETTTTAEYNAVITAPAAPTKTGYTFSGWFTAETGGTKLTDSTKCTGAATYYAQFTVNSYILTWNVDGTETTEALAYGAAITKPADPTKEGYTFAGWDKEIPATMPAGDMTITAKWTVNQYTITFDTDGGSAIETITQDYGTTVTAPADPTKDGYTFAGWDAAVPTTMPAENVTITATWTVNQYTITFDTVGGSEIAPITQDYGTSVTAPADPTKTGYTFAGWDKEIPATMPAGNMTIKAQWTVNQYTITFDTDGGSEIAAITQAYGTSVTAPADPTKEGYTFAGWDVDVPETMPAGDMTITAQWTVNQYTITFDTDGGSEIAAITQDYGTAVTAPADPTKEGYTFAGWDKEIPATMPAENVTIKATWTINQYTITFDTDGGSEIAPITQDYGAAVTAPADPTKDGYTFAGWDAAVPATMPAENMTITAQWTVNQYTITFDTDGGSEIETITQDYGTAVTAPADPTKEGYTFAGWDKEIPTTMPAENVTIKAQWTVNQYTITFDTDGGSETEAITQDYGTAVTAPADPTKEGYTFAGWDKEIPATMPAENVTITATWTINQYTITFENEDGTVLQSAEVEYGSTPEYNGAIPTKAATAQHTYTFAGWTPEIVEVTGEATYTATYTAETIKVYVAQIGETKYETLAAAIEAAESGAEITLLADITDTVTVSKAVTIVKNGFAVTVAAGEGYELSSDTDEFITVQVKKELIPFAGTTMTLGNSLAMNFVISTSLMEGTDNYAVITREYADDRDDVTITIPQSEWKVYSGKLYYFSFNEIAAKEMTDNLYAVVYNNKGEAISVTKQDSVRDYAMRGIINQENGSKDNEKLALYVDMLNYGAAAQEYFDNYHIDDLANGQLTEAQQAYATGDVTVTDERIKGTGYAGGTLTLKSMIQLNFVYNKSAITQDMYAVATYTNHYGDAKSLTIEGKDFLEYSSTRWYIPVTGMSVADCRQLITLTIYDADGTVVSTSCDSVSSYVARSSSVQLNIMVMKFATSAYNSFH